MTTLTTKSAIAAVGFAMASVLMAAQPEEASAMPAIKLTVPTVEAGLVVKAGWRRRAVRRTIRRSVRRTVCGTTAVTPTTPAAAATSIGLARAMADFGRSGIAGAHH